MNYLKEVFGVGYVTTWHDPVQWCSKGCPVLQESPNKLPLWPRNLHYFHLWSNLDLCTEAQHRHSYLVLTSAFVQAQMTIQRGQDDEEGIMNIKTPHWPLGWSQNWASSSSWAESYEEPLVCVYLVILSNYSYIWSKVKIPLIAINEGHIDQILTSTDSPLTCPFRRRGEQEREGERSVWRINMTNLNPFSGIFATWHHSP